jgi:uncharacterized protein YpuA (DUF1002 family)
VPPATPADVTGEAARQAVREALDSYETAVDRAAGGDDDDFDAENLRQTTADIRAALDAGDDERARAAAEDLVERTDEAVDDDVDEEVADRLRSRAVAVREAASLLPADGSGPG